MAGETIIQTIFVSFGHIHKSIINQLPFKNINMNNNIFSIVFEHSTDCFIYILPDGKISGVNKTFEQITGLDAQDYIQGKIKLKDFVHPDDRQIAEQLFHEENKIPSLIEPTIRLVSISRQISYFRLQMHVVEESSEYAGKMVQLTNITEQINNQELRLKNQSLVNENVRYKDYYENAPDIYLSMHPETTLILDCNQTMVDTLGYSKKELKKKTIFDLYTAESALYAKNVLYPEFIRRGLFNNAFVKVCSKNCDILNMLINVNSVKDETGRILYSRAIWRKMADKDFEKEYLHILYQAQQTELKYKLMYDNSPIGIASATLDYKIFSANQAFCDMLGYAEQELVGQTLYLYTHPDGVENNIQMLEKLAAGELKRLQMEKKFIHKSGRTIIGLLNATIIKDIHGKPLYFLGNVHDITLMKDVLTQLEDAKKLTEIERERLNFVLEGSKLGFWDWNIKENKVERNSQWAEMLGFTIDEVQKTVSQWTDLIHPDDHNLALQSLNSHLRGETSMHRAEYRMRTKENDWKWILDTAKVVQFDKNGAPLRMAGTHTHVRLRLLP